MDATELQETWERYWKTRSVEDRNALSECYLDRASCIAVSRRGRNFVRGVIDLDDLKSEASIALIEAVEYFKRDSEAKFTTLLYHFVSRRVSNAIRDSRHLRGIGDRTHQQREANLPVRVVPLCPGRDKHAPKVDARISNLEALRNVTKGLGKRNRIALILYYWEGWNWDEIAVHFSVTKNAIRLGLLRHLGIQTEEQAKADREARRQSGIQLSRKALLCVTYQKVPK
jgi:RNA polymerase sigma factor (sigma-70 family)